MPTFKEFMAVAEMTVKDKTSSKRMEEILAIMRRYQVIKGLTPQKAVDILEALGPTYVKIGQMASSRSDILPAAYCRAFEKLQANVSPMDFATVQQCLDEAYGAPWQTVFASIDEKPLGSASIAQVHKAVLLDGSVVAVKVRRPGIVQQMAEDITMMKHILAWGEFAIPSKQSMMLNLESFVTELERTTANEVDFTVELQNLVRFHRQIQGQEGVSSPLPYPEASRESVLVMEYVQGIEVDDLARRCAPAATEGEQGSPHGFAFSLEREVPTGLDVAVQAGDGFSVSAAPTGMADVAVDVSGGRGADGAVSLAVKPSVQGRPTAGDEGGAGAQQPSDGAGTAPGDAAPEDACPDMAAIARRLVQSYVTQVLDDGFFHADPHPGNIVVRGNQIVWIDLGMVGTLTAAQRALVSQMFHAVTANNAYQLKEAVLALSTVRGEVDQGQLLGQMTVLLQKYGNADLSDINIGEMFEEVIEVMRSQNLIVAPSVTMLARGVMTIEGVLAEIAPDTNVLKVVSDHVLKQEFAPGHVRSRLIGLAGATAESAEAATRLPRQVSDTLDMLGRGELTVVGDMRFPENALATIYAVAGRLSLAIIAVGLFLGSSILCTTAMEPRLLGVPLLGAFGFLGAFVLSVYVIVRTMQSRHDMKNNKKLR